jgi:hypothetical protein
MVRRVIEPDLQRREYAYSCSGKKVKGVIYAKNVLQSMVRGDPKGTRYSIQLDVRHFYDSIDHAILKKMLAKVFRDKRVLDILGEIIDTTQIGLPLGCYPSQELANFYLDSVDHYLKETMRVRHLIRYCDNIEILDGSRRKLLLAKAVIGSMLKSKLNVSIHGNEEVIRVAYDDKSGAIVGERIDFVGYQVCRGWTRIRKRNFKYLRRTALRVMGFIRKGTKIPKSLARRLMSMKGEADNSDSEKIKRMYLYPTLKAARKAVALG